METQFITVRTLLENNVKIYITLSKNRLVNAVKRID